MGQAFEQHPHEPTSDSSTPGGRGDPDAYRLEVSAQPRLSHLGLQHRSHAVCPPLTALACVSVSEPDQRVTFVGTRQTKAISDAVLAPDGLLPGRIIGEVSE